MADPLSQKSKSKSKPAPETDEDAEAEALQFARCSTAPEDPVVGDDKKQPADKARSATAEKLGDDLPRHRELTANLPNLRRSHLTYRHLVISLSTSLVIGLLVLFAGWWYCAHHILPRLSGAPVTPAAATAGTAPGTDLSQAAEQISALQKQVDVMRREQLLMQQNTRESLESIFATLKNPQLVPEPAPAGQPTGQPGAAHLAEMKMDVSPTQQEFIQLKERNRLTKYADEAIATGERHPLEVLVEYMRDPQAMHLHDAAKAEFMRAVRSVQILQREDPGYRLPVAELFKDSSIRDEADVKPEALLKLLADYKQPWEVRVRVCFLLVGSPLPETNAALVKAIREDPSLDVAKHAQLALEQRIKKRFRIFDIPAIEEWFKTQAK